MVVDKTDAIIEMLTNERPVCNLIKARSYKQCENPFDVFREWSKTFFNVTRTKHSVTEIDDVHSVSFWDPGIDIVKVNDFIKSL